MLKRTLIPLLLALCLSTRAGNPGPEAAPVVPDKVYLGFSLMPGANSTLITYKIIRVIDGPKIRYEQQNISRDEFLRIALGLVDSEANPNHENLFVKYEVKDCFYQNDTIVGHIKYDFAMQCPAMDDLWRLRWGEFPFQRAQGADDPGPGWAHDKLGVSEGQFYILQRYGMVNSYSDPIYGENAFKLLHDMQDASWQSNYRGA